MIFQVSGLLTSFIDIIDSLSNTFVNLVIAIVIILIGLVIGKVLEKVIYQMLKEIELNKFLKKSTGVRINADHLISNFFSYFIYFISFVAALDQIGVASVILYLLSGAVLVLILFSFFLAIRDLFPNFIAGIYLYRKEKLKEGNKIEIDDIRGELIHVDLLQTKIKTKKGDILFLPNSIVANSKIKIKKKKSTK